MQTGTGPENENLTLCSPRQSTGQDPNKSVRTISAKPAYCPPNHVLIKVDRFGFSANNITYQALGEHPHFRYFDFHLAPEAEGVSHKSHGLIPVWGFGTVITSTHPQIREGERVYGYLAPTRYLLVPISPSHVNKYAFYVPRPHLPADRRPYNQLLRCQTDPQYTPTSQAENLTMLYRPLFWTSYWCEDWLHSSRYCGGVDSVLISSASSKTAFCLAYLIKKRVSRGELDTNVKIVGLTSKRNIGFTQRLNLYDDVLDYDSFVGSPTMAQGKDHRWIYADVAGNDDLNKRISATFGSPDGGRVVTCISLGMTNLTPSSESSPVDWKKNSFGSLTSSGDPTAATSNFWPQFEQFFMVEWLNVRRHQLPVAEIFTRQNQAWKELMEDCTDWVQLERVNGAVAVKSAYDRLAKEGLGPDKGLIWSMWDEERTWNLSRL